jgi:hypothetical protein
MSDAIVLLALSQLVCLAGVGYLYSQVQRLRLGRPRTRRAAPRFVIDGDGATATARNAAAQAYSASSEGTDARPDRASIVARMTELGLDVPALARRMKVSEEEVRLLLRRQGAQR